MHHFILINDLSVPQILMSVLQAHVRMVVLARMESMDTLANVFWDTLVSTVKSVSINICDAI